MVPAKQKDLSPTLEHVQELFDQWRKHKKRRDPIPPSLWEAAVSLTGTHSIHHIARRLRLNFNELKVRAKNRRPAFVELTMSPGMPLVECSIEMEKPSGERMRIRGACNVVELAREFWKA